MNNKQNLTIIDNKYMRGVIAPAQTLSRNRLTDIIDLIELSSSEIQQETDELIAEADEKNSWMSLDEVEELSAQAV
ncbi:hypothetical protein L6278_01595 [Candidatus Parcubacteria bacterium]|nr:hypothetical protein [Candidatus Parcubacteria bacterium]